MNKEQTSDHIAMLRKHLRSLNRRHVLSDTGSQVEWLSIKRKVTPVQYGIGAVLLVTLVSGVALKADLWQLLATLSALAALGLYYGTAAYKQPPTKTVVVSDREAQTLSAPLAGLEIDLRHLTHLALRGLRPEPRRTIRLDEHSFWFGVYAFVGDEPYLIYLGGEEAREMAQKLAAALSVPLTEPGPNQAPTRLVL